MLFRSDYFTEAQRHDIKGLVVFTKLKSYSDDFDRTNKAWVFVADVDNIGKTMHDITSADFKDYRKGITTSFFISDDDIFAFIRKLKLEERTLVTDFTDTTILPPDLYHKDAPHNGKYQSTPTQLAEEKQKVATLQDQVSDLQNQLATLKAGKAEQQTHQTHQTPVEPPAPTSPVKKRRFGMKERVLKEFNVQENSLDGEQLELIERELTSSMIVTGCAGSGKSVIAMYKAKQIIENGGDVILIAYTKSLYKYMQQGEPLTNDNHHFYYHWQWEKAGRPAADYIIVDEVQDFSREEIEQFIHAARKCFFFFGDTAQSIYSGIKNTVSIKELAEMTGVKISCLNSNYRLPKPVAKITQRYVGIDANPYADSVYQSKETALPYIVAFKNDEAQIDAIVSLVEKKKMKSVGILVPNNELVLSTNRKLSERNFSCELKYNSELEKDNIVTLDFKSSLPKLMTYHSAKGLQFETVFLPFYEGTTDNDARKALYVAMTRTYRYLYVFYKGDKLEYPLSEVPREYFLNTIEM